MVSRSQIRPGASDHTQSDNIWLDRISVWICILSHVLHLTTRNFEIAPDHDHMADCASMHRPWGQALSWRSDTFSSRNSGFFQYMAAQKSQRVSWYCTAVIVVSLAMHGIRRIPCAFQKTRTMIFFGRRPSFHFFGHGLPASHHSLKASFQSYVKWWTHISFLMMIWLRSVDPSRVYSVKK